MHARLRAALLVSAAAFGVGALAPVSRVEPAPPAKDAAPKKQKPGVPDAELQAQIDAAIDRGAAWLRSQQRSGGALGHVKHGGTAYYGIGTTSLTGLALIAAGDKPGSEVLDAAIAYCKAKDAESAASRTTYDAGVLLMFITKYYGKDDEKPARKGRKEDERNLCALPDDAREWARNLTNHLIETQKPETGDWGYPAGRPDFSNTQYALLGLRAAKDCGIPVPPGVWLRTIERTLAAQQEDGPKVPRKILPESGDGPVYVVQSNDRARGWGYLVGDGARTGSMTTAGIAILQIAHDGLVWPRAFPSYKPSKQVEVAQAVADGFAWLDVNFAVDHNPGGAKANWHYYYLYGLERAGALGDRDLLGEHDWYIEGAKYLVKAQGADGRWATGALGGADEYEASDVLDTAWAILFLKRATRRVRVPMPEVTGSR